MLKKVLIILILIFSFVGCGNKVEILDEDISTRIGSIVDFKDIENEIKKSKNLKIDYENGIATVKDRKDKNKIINGKYYLLGNGIIELNVKDNKLDKEIIVYEQIPYSDNNYKTKTIIKVNEGKFINKNYSLAENVYINLESYLEKRRVYRNLIIETNFNYFTKIIPETITQKIFSEKDPYNKIFELKIDPKYNKEKELIKFDEEGNKIIMIKNIEGTNKIEVADFKGDKEINNRIIEINRR